MVDDYEMLRRNLRAIPGDPRATPQATTRGVPTAGFTPEIQGRTPETTPIADPSRQSFVFPGFGYSFQRPQDSDPGRAAAPAATNSSVRGVSALRAVRAGDMSDANERQRAQAGQRAAYNPVDPYGVEFGKGLSQVLGVASKVPVVGLPATLAKVFVDLATEDAKGRQEQMTDKLLSGVVDQPESGITITRQSSGQSESGATTGAGNDRGGGPSGSYGYDPGHDTSGSGGALTGRDRGGNRGGRDGGQSDSGGGGGGLCFVYGTLVRIPGGYEVPIENIRVGELVVSFDADGNLHEDEVTAVIDGEAVDLVWLNGRTGVTPPHPFLRPDGSFTPIGELSPGADLVCAMGKARAIEIMERVTMPDPVKVRNLSVANNRTYIADGYRVHNIKDAGGMVHRKPYDAGGLIGRREDGGDNSDRMPAERPLDQSRAYDAGGAVGGDMAPMFRPMDAGGMPVPAGGLAPPGNGRVMVPAQEGEFVMSRAATQAYGPGHLAAMNQNARDEMGSDDMMGNTYPKMGAEQGAGPGPNPMMKQSPVAPEQISVVMQAMGANPDLASALIPLLSPDGRQFLMESIGAAGFAPQSQSGPAQMMGGASSMAAPPQGAPPMPGAVAGGGAAALRSVRAI